jgi:delta 1-pyrroline-5-carboxylate dehydrogenase
MLADSSLDLLGLHFYSGSNSRSESRPHLHPCPTASSGCARVKPLCGDPDRVLKVNQLIAALDGPLVLVQSATTEEMEADVEAYCLNWLLEEVSTSINTAAAGGNASLMTIG